MLKEIRTNPCKIILWNSSNPRNTLMSTSKLGSFLPLVLVFLCGAVLSTPAQKDKETKAPKSPLIVKSNLLVVDPTGQYAVDINQSEIKVLENGVEQKVTYFAKKDPGLNLAIVVDNTGSMRERLNMVIKIGKLMVNNLAEKDESTLIRFVSREKITIEQPWTSNKQMMYEVLDNLFVEGGYSAIADALYLAAEMTVKRDSEAKSKRSAIFMITDAEERDSYYELKEALKHFENTDVQVFVLAFTGDLTDKPTQRNNYKRNGKTNAEKFARSISANTFGVAHVFGGPYTDENLLSALKSVMIELRSQYVIGYTPNDRDKDTVRNLSVTIADGAKGEKRKAVTRERVFLPVD